MKMRKVLAMLLSAMLIMSASITALGATKSDVEAKIKSAAKFVLDGSYGADGYRYGNSKYFLMYLRAGRDADVYAQEYLSSVKDALDNGYVFGVGSIGLTLSVMDLLGVDASDFEGYDLVEMFEATDVTENEYSPYNYVYAIETARAYGLYEYGALLCDQLITYYTMGEGTDFWGGWGTSPDDLAMFALGLAPYEQRYEEYIDDALALLETYNSDEGYMSWGEASADSTALALAAYAASKNKAMADQVYEKLLLFYDEETGGFIASYDEYLATADALFGMEYYINIADEDAQEEKPSEETTKNETTQKAEESTDKGAEEVKDKPADKSPNTGSVSNAAFAIVAIALAGGAVMLAKKKENI